MFTPDDLPTLHRMQDIARRVDAMIHSRACREYGLAFGHDGSKSLNMCVIHNSLVSRDQGQPWPEVNYDHMRRAKWLTDRSHDPHRIVHSWYQRKIGR